MIALHTLCSDSQLPMSLICNYLHSAQACPKAQGQQLSGRDAPFSASYRKVAVFLIDFFFEHVTHDISFSLWQFSGIYNHFSLFLQLSLL